MLIKCDRHTADDLELWEDMEETDRLFYATHNMKRKETETIERLLAFAAMHPTHYVSVSWGKDSVVLAHLVYRAGIRSRLVYISAMPVSNPYCAVVRDAFLSACPMQYHEMVLDYGCRAPYGDGLGHEADGLFRAFGELLTRTLGKRVTGIRRVESGRRRVRFARWGHESTNTFCPIGYWDTADVYAYLAHYDLPTHPNYAMLGGGRWRREDLRVDFLGGDAGDQFGRAEWEAEYYGDVLRMLQSQERNLLCP